MIKSECLYKHFTSNDIAMFFKSINGFVEILSSDKELLSVKIIFIPFKLRQANSEITLA